MSIGLASKSIASIKGRGAALDIDIHATAVAAIYTSMDHKDANTACLLLNAMPKGSRAKTLALWFMHYSNIVVTAKDGVFSAKMMKEDHADYKASPDVVAALAKPFWSVEEKVDAAAFDTQAFAKAVAALIKRAGNDNANLDSAGKAALADLRVLAVKVPVAA
jgi:hypothetical protein